MTQGVARESVEIAERSGEEADGRLSLSRFMGMLRRRNRQRTEGEMDPVQESTNTSTAHSPSAVVTRLEADIAELERRLQALEDDEQEEAEQARMLHLLLRNRKDVLERAKARKFLLDGASYGVK